MWLAALRSTGVKKKGHIPKRVFFSLPPISAAWLRVLRFGIRFQGLGDLRALNLGFRVSVARFQVSGFGLRASGFRFGFWVSGFGFRVSSLKFRFQGLGFRV